MVSKKRRAEELTNCWNGSDNFTKLQLVKNRRFPGSIKTNHENSHLFLAKKTREKFSEHTSHDESLSTGENTDLKISSTSTAKNDSPWTRYGVYTTWYSLSLRFRALSIVIRVKR